MNAQTRRCLVPAGADHRAARAAGAVSLPGVHRPCADRFIGSQRLRLLRRHPPSCGSGGIMGWSSLGSCTPTQVFDSALHGDACTVHVRGGGSRPLSLRRWSGLADSSDRAVLAHCVGRTIDLGCGPGRMAQALQHNGAAGTWRGSSGRRRCGHQTSRCSGARAEVGANQRISGSYNPPNSGKVGQRRAWGLACGCESVGSRC